MNKWLKEIIQAHIIYSLTPKAALIGVLQEISQQELNNEGVSLVDIAREVETTWQIKLKKRVADSSEK